MATYASYYISSNGQPMNGYAEHTSKRDAINRARLLRDNLLHRSGGHAYAVQLPDQRVAHPDDEPDQDIVLYNWYEHAEGGYAAWHPGRVHEHLAPRI